MVIAPAKLEWTPSRANVARKRYVARHARLDRHTTLVTASSASNDYSKESILEEVLARVKARRAKPQTRQP